MNTRSSWRNRVLLEEEHIRCRVRHMFMRIISIDLDCDILKKE